MEKNDEFFMNLALDEAKKAREFGEVPIGCVITLNNEVVSSAYNKRELSQNALFHAEILAINQACEKIKFWRLCDCELFVTLEPCPMCFGAVINSRIKRVIFGADDKKAGVLGSVVNLNEFSFNHKPTITRNILSDECGKILSDFFSELRKTKKNNNKDGE